MAKKSLSLLLVLCMLLSVFSSTVYAEDGVTLTGDALKDFLSGQTAQENTQSSLSVEEVCSDSKDKGFITEENVSLDNVGWDDYSPSTDTTIDDTTINESENSSIDWWGDGSSTEESSENSSEEIPEDAYFFLDMEAPETVEVGEQFDVVFTIKNIKEELAAIEFFLDFDATIVDGVIKDSGSAMNAFMTKVPMYTAEINGITYEARTMEQICYYNATKTQYELRFIDILQYPDIVGDEPTMLINDGDLVVTIPFIVLDTAKAGDKLTFELLEGHPKGTTSNGLNSVSGYGDSATVTVVGDGETSENSSVIASGTCGDDLTWSLDDNGTLVISGTGAMYDYSSNGTPWYSYVSNIKTVIIQDGVTTIGDYAFYRGESLTSVTIGDSVTTIGDYAFYFCESLTSVTIPDSVTTIGDYAFSYSSSLASVTIPDSVTSIGDRTFYCCTSLTSATIPDSVTTIGDWAFYSCISLEFVTIPDSVITVGYRAFCNCDSITSVTIGNSVTSIGDYAFLECSSLTEINVTENNSMYSSENGVLFNKDKTTLICYPSGKNDSSYTIPDFVTTIGYGAFSGCESLISVTLPDSVTTIGNRAFADCSSLASITIPDSVTTIGDDAFSYCSSLASITIPGSVATIGYRAFYYCISLESVTIPDSVTTIGDYAFYNCDSLTSVNIPNSVTTIGDYAFYNCDSLTSVTIGSFVTAIGYRAFCYCPSLASITIPDSVTTIGDEAFAGCYDLTLVNYTGTEKEWNKIHIGSDNDHLLNATINFLHTHSWSGWTTETEPTCTETGVEKRTCSTCGDIESQTIEKLGHTWSGWTTEKEPTCTEVGSKVKVCTVCGNKGQELGVTSEEFPKCIGTDYTHKMDTTFKTFSVPDACKIVIHFSSDSYVESGYDYVYVYAGDSVNSSMLVGKYTGSLSGTIVTVDASSFTIRMTTDGSVSKHGFEISSIDYYIKDAFETIPATGHSYGDWTTETEPTCTETGIEKRTCSTCGDIESQTIEALGHDYSSEWTIDKEATCTEDGSKSHHCSRCGDKSDVTAIEKTGHSWGEWIIDNNPTCTQEGKKHKTCSACEQTVYESIEKLEHSYEPQVVSPTYLDQGYTLHTCSACGDSYKDSYVDALPRIDLSSATLELEYTSAFYKGVALMPDVNLTYEGEKYDSSEELTITYSNNDKVGIATVTITGINKFIGTVDLQFEISYETIPEKIVNVIAIGEIGKVSLSWGKSTEVETTRYNIYRKSENETEYQLIKTIVGRETLSYEDNSVTKGVTYNYYVTGTGLYGAESEAFDVVTAKVLFDEIAPVILKLNPTSASCISGNTTFSAVVSDNMSVTKVVYFYSIDNGESWTEIGETKNSSFSITFNVSHFNDETIKIKAIAYDAEGNESEPFTAVYSLDTVGPEKVTGLSAITLSSKITLSWNDVEDNDASHFILQTKSGESWKTISSSIKTLGYTLTGLQPDTDYIYRVACVDNRGNIGEYSDEFTARTAKDTTAPVITNQSPAPSRHNNSINFSATAKDDCDIETIEIQVSTDLIVWTTISTNTFSSRKNAQSYSYTIKLSDYAEGSIFVRAIATDFSGNVSDTSKSAPFTEYIIDRTAPEAPSDVKAIGHDGYITIEWSMGSENDLGTYYVYKSTSIDGEYQLIASSLSSVNYIDRNVQSETEFYYKVKVTDTCGNMSEFSSVVHATMSNDSQKPEITGISSTYQQKISPYLHTIHVAATDNNKLSHVVVEYFTSKNPEYTQLLVSENIDNHYKDISIDLPIENLENGDIISIRAYAVDMAGLKSDYVTVKYTMDTIAPSANNFTPSLENDVVVLSWEGCGESDLSGFKVYCSTDGSSFTFIGSRGANSTGTYTLNHYITTKESHTYVYKLEAIDRVGNKSSCYSESIEYTFVYINQSPVASMKVPNYMTIGVEEKFDASGSKDDISITSYLWDFGDGTFSNEVMPIKKYDSVGSYTVTLSVTDNEGCTSTISRSVEVKERQSIGTLKVEVIDEKGNHLPFIPVYFDLGEENQQIIYTNNYGVATVQLPSGTHKIGAYTSGYLPVKKEVVVLANAERTVLLKTIKQEIVTGHFEITRMTFDEIVAAGIDVFDPANQQVYSATVKITYGKQKLNINYKRNKNKIIDFDITDDEGDPIIDDTIYPDDGDARCVSGIIVIPGEKSDVVAIVDIPAQATYLKEFFDVRLHIINNASSEFTLTNNDITLNVPDGMTLMTTVTNAYSASNHVTVDSIKGQETATIAWVLRGDNAGEYHLSADYSGILSEFNELITATFKTETPIKVYGLKGVKFRVMAADEIHNDTLYFNVELENERDIDIHMPTIAITEKITNLTESLVNHNPEGDFEDEAYILNAYIQSENGKKIYIPVLYDKNGKAYAQVETLAPGWKLVCEYVVYNAINYNGVAQFKEAVITSFKGLSDNIEVGSFHKKLYSFTDYEQKLDNILYGSDFDIKEAFYHIYYNTEYYYSAEAKDKENGFLHAIYSITDTLFNADFSHLTKDEQKELIRDTILTILADSSVVEQVDDLIMDKYHKITLGMLENIKIGLIQDYVDDGATVKNITKTFENLVKDSKSLAITYSTKGSEAFHEELVQKLIASEIGIAIDSTIIFLYADEAGAVSKVFGAFSDIISSLTDIANETNKDMYYYAVLKLNCNAEISEKILNAIMTASNENNMKNVEFADMVYDIAKKMKSDLEKNVSETYILIKNAVKEAVEVAGEEALKGVLKEAMSTTPMILISATFNIMDTVFGWGSFYKQQDRMCIYEALSMCMINAFRTETSAFYSMVYLRALCELRLSGESQFYAFMQDYLGGVYGSPLSKDEVLDKINVIFGTVYSSIDEWWDDVQYNIVHSRDLMFNIEAISDVETPRAPIVTLDYETLKTEQSFTEEYEYCFADGVWKDCNNEPISFTVGITPSVLRVRVKASETNFVGEITTVRIYAQKELSKLIEVKFDGSAYVIENLYSERSYEILFVDSLSEEFDWSKSKYISVNNTTAKVYGQAFKPYAVIRSCINSSLLETYSIPLTVTVSTKVPLSLKIEGKGTVSQTALSGCYYYGESVDLIAKPTEGCDFLGWYIDGKCVSTDLYYVIEQKKDLIITAKFSGSSISKIEITKEPIKLEYYEDEALDINGLEVYAYYEDGTSLLVENFTVHMTSNEVGNVDVIVEYGGYSDTYSVSIIHQCSDWIIVSEATPKNEGYSYQVCYTCKNIIQEESSHVDSLAFSGASLTLQDDLIVNFKTKIDSINNNGYENPYVVFVINGKETIVTEYRIVGDSYVFDFVDIVPHMMNDTISATLYATYNGVEYSSESKEYSIAMYCYTILERYTSDSYAKLRTVIVDLLNYGAESQKFMNYRVDALVNANLTDEQKAWGTTTDRELVNSLNVAYETINNPSVTWKGAGLNLEQSVGMRFKLATDSLEGLTVKVTGEAGEWTIDSADFEATGNAYYVFLEGMHSGQMSKKVYLTAYRNGVAVSNTLCYSIESYAAQMQNSAISSLVKAMIRYGDSSKAFAG